MIPTFMYLNYSIIQQKATIVYLAKYSSIISRFESWSLPETQRSFWPGLRDITLVSKYVVVKVKYLIYFNVN